MDKDTDVIIIGGGPAGLHMVFQSGLYGMRSLLIDALPQPGGQLAALYPDKIIYDVPGFPSILAQELIERLLAQAKSFEPRYRWGERVDTLSFADGRWTVGTAQGRWRAPVVVLAAGIGAFAPKRPRAEGLEHYERLDQVRYQADAAADWHGRRILIQGGTAQAVAAAVAAAQTAAGVDLVHRKDEFELLPQHAEPFRQLRQAGRIRCHIPYTVNALGGTDAQLKWAKLKGYGTADVTVETDLFLPLLGFGAALGPIKDWALPLQAGAVAVDPASMESPKRQLYVIGDMAAYAGKAKLIVTGFSEAAIAARHAFNYIYPGTRLPTAYSSNIGPLDLGRTRPHQVEDSTKI
ncbi:MAG: NAD(P)/FAD-dependent oxidoreductase [Pseudomonadota bacterium]